MSRIHVLLAGIVTLALAAVANAQETRKTEVIHVNNVNVNSLAPTLEMLIRNTVIVADPVTNTLTVTAAFKDIERIKKKIVELDVPTPTINIQFGVFAVNNGQEQCLSAPSVVTADGQTARVLIGQSFPVGLDKEGRTVYEDVGVRIPVVAKKQPDGRWQIDFTVESATAERAFKVQIVRRSIRSVSMVKTGDTVQIEASTDDAGQKRLRVMFTVIELAAK